MYIGPGLALSGLSVQGWDTRAATIWFSVLRRAVACRRGVTNVALGNRPPLINFRYAPFAAAP